MFWITRDHVHVDRVACPWLIKRFIDKDAQFIFMPKDQILDFVKKTNAIPYDTPGAEIYHYEKDGIKYCSFDSLIEKYHLDKNEALQDLRKIVRATDTGKLEDQPLSFGLEAIASGAPLLVNTDHDALALEFPFYDTLYAYLQREIIIKRYKKEMEGLKARSEITDFIKEKIHELWKEK